MTVLLVYQLIGEIAVIVPHPPIPGPFVGMAPLFASLIPRGGATGDLRDTSGGPLRHQ